jgi:hypothetical protein
MRFLDRSLNRLFQHSRNRARATSRTRCGLAVECLEGRNLLALGPIGIHIPPMGLSGPGVGHVTPSFGSTPTGGRMFPVQIPPMGISRPGPRQFTPSVMVQFQQMSRFSPISMGGGMMGQATFRGGMMGPRVASNPMMGGLMAGGGMMSGMMMSDLMLG